MVGCRADGRDARAVRAGQGQLRAAGGVCPRLQAGSIASREGASWAGPDRSPQPCYALSAVSEPPQVPPLPTALIGSERLGAGRRLRVALAFLLGLPVIGTLGYRWLTGAPWLDALYFTMITVTTVGYGEILPIQTPASRIFTIGLLVATLLGTAWAASVAGELLIGEYGWRRRRRQRMQQNIDALRGHVIICGYGRMGQRVALELSGEGRDWVAVELDAERAAAGAQAGGRFVIGDARDDAALSAAGIERAQALIGVMRQDADNIVLALSARSLNPRLRIVMRADRADAVAKLRLAGADYVLRHHDTAALHLTLAVTHPVVESALNLLLPRQGGLDLGQVLLQAGSPLVGRRLGELRLLEGQGLVVALSRGDALRCPPPLDEDLAAGDILVAAGLPGALSQLRMQAEGRARA